MKQSKYQLIQALASEALHRANDLGNQSQKGQKVSLRRDYRGEIKIKLQREGDQEICHQSGLNLLLDLRHQAECTSQQ